MTLLSLIGLALCFAVAVYLFVALLSPENFE